MYFAIVARTQETVRADRYLIRSRRYLCPCCKDEVILRAGRFREAHFAHKSGKTNRECEEYHPGSGTGSGHHAPHRLEVEDKQSEVGLCLSVDGDAWYLYLRLPEISDKEFFTCPIRDLLTASVRVSVSGSTVGEIQAIDLRPGTGIARGTVPPSLTAYQLSATGRWPTTLSSDTWNAYARGLQAKGNVFRLKRGEWIRLRERSSVEWGEQLLVVMDNRVKWPNGYRKPAGEVKDGDRIPWALFQIALPANPLLDWNVLLGELGHTIVEPRWGLRCQSLPESSDDESGLPTFRAKEALLMVLTPPPTGGKTAITFEAHSNRYMVTVLSPGQAAAPIYVKVVAPSEGYGTLLVEDQRDSRFGFYARQIASRATIKGVLKGLPRLTMQVGEHVAESWGDPLTLRHPGPSRDLPLIVIETGLDFNRSNRIFRIVLPTSRGHKVQSGLTQDRVVAVLRTFVEEGGSGLVQIDAGALGRVAVEVIPWLPASSAISSLTPVLEYWTAAIRPNLGEPSGSAPLPAFVSRLTSTAGKRISGLAFASQRNGTVVPILKHLIQRRRKT